MIPHHAVFSLRRLAPIVFSLFLIGCGQSQGIQWEEVDRLIAGRFPDVPRITVAELSRVLSTSRPVILLDAREPEEFAVSHLAGALRATSSAEVEIILAEADPDALVVVYCSVGYRSAALVEALRSRGVAHIVNLQGSIFAWANEGRPVYRGDIEVSSVHPFDDSWGTLLDRSRWATEPALP